MRYVLLTWNPGPGNEEQYTPQEWLEEMVLPLQAGRQPAGNRWSIGTNWHTIDEGDQVCMLRQGAHGRGIVATGVVTHAPFEKPHWDPDKSGDAHYVNVAWVRALPLNQMITIEELEQQVTGFKWNQVYSSGRIVDGEPGDALAALLGQGPPRAKPIGKGQQFGSTEHNRLVELEAMRVASHAYASKGWLVRDVSAKNLGWDLEATRGHGTKFIEVKGVTGTAPEFFLTPNEYRAARDHAQWVAVVITGVFGAVTSILEVEGADVVAAADPIQYRVAVP